MLNIDWEGAMILDKDSIVIYILDLLGFLTVLMQRAFKVHDGFITIVLIASQYAFQRNTSAITPAKLTEQ